MEDTCWWTVFVENPVKQMRTCWWTVSVEEPVQQMRCTGTGGDDGAEGEQEL